MENIVSKPRILFISSRNPKTTTVRDGGVSLTSSNLRSLESFCDVTVVDLFPKQDNLFCKMLRFLFCYLNYSGGFSPLKKARLFANTDFTKLDAVFLDSSLYGRLAKDIKSSHPQIPVITHFHNIEQKYPHESQSAPGFTRKILTRSAKFNEQAAVDFSDHLICLSEKDSAELLALYGKPATSLLPITLSSAKEPPKNHVVGDRPVLLFCGSNFAPNVEGLKWFIQNVFPQLDCELHIVGYGMEKVDFKGPGITNHGTVTETSAHYEKASAVVSPILFGSGMKTKTIEALKFGKIVFGSTEAWRGIQRPSGLPLYLCDTPIEFITAIKSNLPKGTNTYSPEVRDYFEEKFSESMKISSLEKILTQTRG